jgi:hypothetical protein
VEVSLQYPHIFRTMKLSALLTSALASLAIAQTPALYTDPKTGITFNTLQHSSGLFFGLALPANATANTDFIATIGGKGTGWSGVSLGGGMLNKLLIVAWPNAQTAVSSFRKARYVPFPPFALVPPPPFSYYMNELDTDLYPAARSSQPL